MRRAESLLTHMSRKYVGRVYVCTRASRCILLDMNVPLLLSFSSLSFFRLHTHTRGTSDLF